MRITRPIVRLVFPLLLTVLPTVGFSYGNGSSFSRAGTSLVDYTDSPLRPVIECASLNEINNAQLSILSADLIVTNGKTAEHCQVYGMIAPEIQFSLQLPSHWNGRLYVHGNGGDAGESVYGEYGSDVRDRAVARGFVATFSNTGHARADFQGSRWAHNNVQREIDYSYRALHLNTLAAKQISQRYYGRVAARTYFDGCSTGGGQGLRAAHRFPADFDGIVAGAPVFDPVALLLYVWNNQRAQQLMQLDRTRLAKLGEWLLQKYDALDGATDGVISNPAAIDFDAHRDLPRGKQGFNEREIAGLALAYGGLEIEGRRKVPGIPLGAESAGQKYLERSFEPAPPSSAWLERVLPDADGMVIMQRVLNEWLRYVLFEVDDPARDWQALDIAATVPEFEAKTRLLSVRDPDLAAFKERGGKLIIYNGWGDVGVNPYFALDFYQQLRAKTGRHTKDFARLFMVPGMFHCRGGLNVDRFDVVTVLIEWVEGGKAPDRIAAVRMDNGRITRSRPLCPYPLVARYDGSGSIDEAANFNCKASAP